MEQELQQLNLEHSRRRLFGSNYLFDFRSNPGPFGSWNPCFVGLDEDKILIDQLFPSYSRKAAKYA
jgi:hypothetical protein